MLKGTNVTLRLFREAELEEYLSLYNQCTERGAYYPTRLQSLSTARKEFQENGWWDEHLGRMLITDKQDRMLGMIFFFKGAPNQEGYEVGYILFRQTDRGRGVMSEALPIFSAYLFEIKPIGRLYLLAATENAASRRVAEKSGYQLDGILRHGFFLQGRLHDCAIYSLLRAECPTLAECLRRPGKHCERGEA